MIDFQLEEQTRQSEELKNRMKKLDELREETAAKKEEEERRNPYNLANIFGRETAIGTVTDVTNLLATENANE